MTKGVADLILHLVGEVKRYKIQALLAETDKEKEAFEKRAADLTKEAKKAKEFFTCDAEIR